MSRILAFFLALAVSACALPSPDQPAHPSRMGRFLGLVANCGCSDIDRERMLETYAKTLGGRYSEAEAKSMRGYVDLGAYERFENQMEICREACGQACMVNAVVEPLGGQAVAGAGTCLVSERDLHLTVGRTSDGDWP